MSKRLLTVALVLGTLAAACSAPPDASVSLSSGQQFVPQVADFLDNAGLDPSIVVTADGTPTMTYFTVPENLAKGEIPATRPIGYPTIPGVMLTSEKGGVWTHGAVAIEQAVPTLTVPSSPAFEASVKDLTASNVIGTAIALDGQGKLHVAWSANGALWYADNTSGAFQATQVLTEAPTGISIAVDPSGVPRIAYNLGGEVQAATPSGSEWTTEKVADAPGCATCQTATGVNGEGRPFVAFADGSQPVVSTLDGKAWGVPVAIESGAGGQGLSMAVDRDGNPHVAYYAGGEVHEAQSIAGAPWQVTKVADVGSSSATAEGAGTGIGVDDQGVNFVAYYDDGTNSVGLASNDGGTFAAIPTLDTKGGIDPALAVTPDGKAVYVAWYDDANQNLEMGTYGDATGLALANPSPALPPPTAPAAPSGGCDPKATITISAPPGAGTTGFAETNVTAPAGNTFGICFKNDDPGVPHNVHVFTDSGATTSISAGAVITGVDVDNFDVKPLAKGSYFYHCDIHPTTMTGTLVIK